MPHQVFTVTSWEEQPFDGPSDGLKITQAIVSTNFVGDIQGVGSVIYIMKHQENGMANFIGLQQINGSIGNLKGTFAIEQNGFFDGKEAKGTCIVQKGSGTGDFANLNGEGRIHSPHGQRRFSQPKLQPLKSYSTKINITKNKHSRLRAEEHDKAPAKPVTLCRTVRLLNGQPEAQVMHKKTNSI